MKEEKIFIGIDVSKRQLDVFVRPTGEYWNIDNNEKGIAEIVGRLKSIKPTIVVIESTGGLEALVANEIAAVQFLDQLTLALLYSDIHQTKPDSTLHSHEKVSAVLCAQSFDSIVRGINSLISRLW
jgi:hypothetical protein